MAVGEMAVEETAGETTAGETAVAGPGDGRLKPRLEGP
jgi:hypothetical protein